MVEPLKSEVILSVYIMSFLIGMPANLLALCAFSVKIYSKAHLTDILLLNLTISDLIFLVILPLKMHEAASDMTWNLPYWLCSLTNFVYYSTIYTSSLLLMTVSVVRYIGIAYPISYHQLQKPVYATVISAGIWIISLGHCSVVFILQHHPSLPRNNSTLCFEDFTEEQLDILLPLRFELFFLFCLIPVLVCVYCYLRCILILHSRPMASHMQKQKAIGMAIGSIAMFLICVLPFSLSQLLSYFKDENPTWRHYTLLCSTLNTCIDPIIFYFATSTFRCTSENFIFRKRGVTDAESQRQATSTS